MELILRFSDGVQGSVAVILHIPVWVIIAAILATALSYARPGSG